MTRIQIVDDNSNDRYMLEKLLKGYDYDVTTARNGAEALRLARKEPPDMIISDIMMPVMDGFGLCREWKKDEKLKNIPFIFYTATYTTYKDEEFAKNIGADLFIIKPQEIEDLVAKLREVIEEHRAGKLAVSEPPLEEEMEFFRQYNEVLFQKLEKKITQLHTEINERKRIENELEKNRKHLEELVKERTSKLRDSEVKYRTLYESSSDAIMMLDEKGFFDCNNATLNIFGFSKKEDFTRVHPADVSPPYQPDGTDSLTAANNKISEAFMKGMNSFEWMHQRQNGEDFPAEVLLTAFQLGEKQVLQATVRDITQRKRVEAELLTEKIFTDTTIDSIPGTFYVVDNKGRFIRWNKAVEELTGQSAEKLRGMNSLFFIHEDDRKRVAKKIREVFEKGFAEDVARVMTMNEIRDYILTGRRMAFGKNMYLVGCGVDITERKQAVDSLRLAKEEAERANMAKTNFLHTMSHELRTPLNAILGFSELMKQETIGELNEKQKRFIDNIITGGKNLHNIISQILDEVKMDEGTLELRIENISVPETLEEVIDAIKEKAEKKNVLLEIKLDPQMKYMEADKQKFKQVFANLLDNALKFSKDEGGTVIINAKKEGDVAEFSVSDTGIGIKEEDMDKIFQKFTQIDSGTTRKYGGTGLGLSITKQLVEMHGGRIWAESKYGEGSKFTFTLPLVPEEGGL